MLIRRPALIKYLLKDHDIGATVATSKFGVKKVCSKIDPLNSRVIVEYGPGTGVFTDYILSQFKNLEKLILIEKNKDLCNFLEKTIDDKRVYIFNDNAKNVSEILKQFGNIRADYIISGIPFSYFDDELKLKIINNTYNSLTNTGKFLVYQYRKLMMKYLLTFFSRVIFELEVRNFPPLFIFEAIK